MEFLHVYPLRRCSYSFIFLLRIIVARFFQLFISRPDDRRPLVVLSVPDVYISIPLILKRVFPSTRQGLFPLMSVVAGCACEGHSRNLLFPPRPISSSLFFLTAKGWLDRPDLANSVVLGFVRGLFRSIIERAS